MRQDYEQLVPTQEKFRLYRILALEDVSCSYIDAIRKGQYDDVQGNVVTDLIDATGLSGNMYFAEYSQSAAQIISEVTPLQIGLLVLSISAFLVLFSWSASLNKTLRKSSFNWKPRHGKGEIEELGSSNDNGLPLGRHTSYYMS